MSAKDAAPLCRVLQGVQPFGKTSARSTVIKGIWEMERRCRVKRKIHHLCESLFPSLINRPVEGKERKS